jgi:hypothetical protein
MTSKKVRVLVGSPIYQKPHILQKFKRLDAAGKELAYFFIDDNEDARRFQSGAEQCQITGIQSKRCLCV